MAEHGGNAEIQRWEWIDCIFADGMTDIDRQLWEIDENLMRAELSPTEMAEHLAKRKELWDEREAGGAELGGSHSSASSRASQPSGERSNEIALLLLE